MHGTCHENDDSEAKERATELKKRERTKVQRLLSLLNMILILTVTVASIVPREAKAAESEDTVVDVQPNENVNSQTASTQQVDASNEQNASDTFVNNSSTGDSVENQAQKLLIQYVALTKDTIQAGETEEVVIGTVNENLYSSISLVINSEDGNSYTFSNLSKEAGILKFDITSDNIPVGKYSLGQIVYDNSGATESINLASISIDAKFANQESIDTNPDAYVDETGDAKNSDIEKSVVQIDDNTSLEIATQEIKETTQDAVEESDVNWVNNSKKSSGNVVVVLDPGHDDSHPGTAGNGLNEKDINLKIAQYCKSELEQYSGVTVYMTRNSGTCPYPGTTSGEDNANRVAFAKSVGANIYVAIHINYSSNSGAHGAEVYYPNSNYNSAIGAQGQAVASKILTSLASTGLKSRGLKIRNSENNTVYPDGSLADYYGIIRNGKLSGIPAIIVEHAFLSSSVDTTDHLSTDSQLQQLGIADATGIAQAYGLTKGISFRTIRFEAQNDYINVVADVAGEANLQYRYQVYDQKTGSWSLLSEWTTSNKVAWKPAAGQYIVDVVVVDSRGNMARFDAGYSTTRNYSSKYVELNGMCWNVRDTGIDVGVAYTTNDNAVKFSWSAYDLNAQKWEKITDWNSGNWSTWKPAKGNYWLHVEAKDSNGDTCADTVCFAVDKDYTTDYVRLNGICYVQNRNSIDVGVAYESGDKNTAFRWKQFDLNKREWRQISDWYSGNWATWKPEAGDYWLYVEAKTSSGYTRDYVICYHVERDYSKEYVDVNGIYIQPNQVDYSMAASYQSDDKNPTFKWQVYSIEKNTWTSLNDWSGINSISWFPEDGHYWIKVDAKTSDNTTGTYTQGITISARYSIMGDSSTTVDQMIRYYNKNATYPSYYSHTDAPTIRDFCTIYAQECNALGVKTDVAFAQAMKETGFLRFGGQVDISQFNFAGLGATDGGAKGESFSSVREGIRAQVQHLQAYGSNVQLDKSTIVDPRYSLVTRNSAPFVEWLGIKENPYGKGWATSTKYGYSIINDYIAKLLYS